MELFINMENKETNKTPLYKLKKFIERFKDIYNCIDLTLLVRYLFQVVEKQEERIERLEDENRQRVITNIINKIKGMKKENELSEHDELLKRLKRIEQHLQIYNEKESN